MLVFDDPDRRSRGREREGVWVRRRWEGVREEEEEAQIRVPASMRRFSAWGGGGGRWRSWVAIRERITGEGGGGVGDFKVEDPMLGICHTTRHRKSIQ